MRYSKKEKMAIAERVCERYEKGDVTLNSCCDAIGVNANTFYQWACPGIDDFSSLPDDKQTELKRRGFVQEIHDTLKRAKKINEINFKKLLRNVAREGLIKLVRGGEYEEVHTTEKLDENGKVIAVTEKRVKKFREPDVTAVIFALKNMDKDNFADITKIISDFDSPERRRLREMSDEELLAEEQKIIDQLVKAQVSHKLREGDYLPE